MQRKTRWLYFTRCYTYSADCSCVRKHKSEEVTIEKNSNINMYEILIMKFQLVYLMILHTTIAHVQNVSAVIADIRHPRQSQAHVRQKVGISIPPPTPSAVMPRYDTHYSPLAILQ